LITISLLAACCALPEWQLDRTAIVVAQARCGGIEGRVTTPEGWMIPMARIYFFNKETKKNTNVESDQDGQYTTCLTRGTYDVSVNAQEFKSAKRKRITVEDGVRSIIDFPLKRGRPQTSH
jgi:hypothetical protein